MGRNKMKNKILALLLALTMVSPVFAYTVGSVNYREILQNYSKAKAVQSEIEDRENSMQRFLLDKEKEFKKIQSPVQKKSFEEQTAKAFAQQQAAYQSFKNKKEKEIDDAIVDAIKSVAIENKIDTVMDARVMFFGAVDITQKVITKLNIGGK
jgi:Skp family chaperone for outer membrane proteins